MLISSTYQFNMTVHGWQDLLNAIKLIKQNSWGLAPHTASVCDKEKTNSGGAFLPLSVVRIPSLTKVLEM